MARLFEPLRIGTLTARNRMVRAAACESLAAADGRPLPELAQLYARLAAGGVGAIITGFAYVTKDGKSSPNALGLYDDAFMDEYRLLTRTAHEHGARIVLQLVYGGSKSRFADDDPRRMSVAQGDPAPAGSYPDSEDSVTAVPNMRVVGPSAVACPGTDVVPCEATPDDIARIRTAFAEAAVRAKQAGFDGVEVHAAHGYLLSQFFNPLLNRRNDAYGGSLENRARIACECVEAVRNAVGEDYPVLVKMNSYDSKHDPCGENGGYGTNESAQVAAWLAEAGASALEISGDWHAFAPAEITGEPFFGAFGAQVAASVGIPVVVTGGWRDPRTIERYLSSTDVAGVGLCRPLICEPDLPLRWETEDASPAKCVSCNLCGKKPGLPCVQR